MCYTNSRYLDCSQDGNLELRLDNEVVEEGESTAIMVAEQGAQRNCRSTRSSLSKSLTSSFISAPLAILSMLKCASGSVIEANVGSSSSSSYECGALSFMCRIINLARHSNSTSSTSRIIVEAGRVRITSRFGNGSDFDNMDISLDVNDPENQGVDNEISLHGISRRLNRAYRYCVENPRKFNLETSSANYYLCNYGVASFCDREYRENSTLLDECCPGINSYISGVVHSTTSSTVASEVTNSTTPASEVTNSTTLASEVMNSTTLASEVTNSTTLASEVMNSTTLASEVMNSTTLASEVINSTTLASEVTNSTTLASEVMNSTTLASEVMNSTTLASEVINSTTLASEVMNSTTLASEVMNSTTLASEVINSTTLASEVTNSTTLASEIMNSTSVESTIFTPTEIIPINKDLTIFVVVLVAFLSLAVALLSFVGYKRCSQKKVQQVQHVSQSDDSSDEEAEDLV
nr:hypothetical protein [Candidatus Ichthyocystis hellenicum]